MINLQLSRSEICAFSYLGNATYTQSLFGNLPPVPVISATTHHTAMFIYRNIRNTYTFLYTKHTHGKSVKLRLIYMARNPSGSQIT